MRLFKKVAIVGVGLIGGSIALAMKKKKLAGEIVGVSRHRNTLKLALKRGAIDRGSLNLKIIEGADLIVLCAPVGVILNQAREIAAIAPKSAIVTDVGSTKQAIVSRLDKIFPRYIGSHPLAGSQRRGILNAQSDIFKGSLCILTPSRNTHRPTQDKIKRLWLRLGARVITLPAARHDKILSFTSHLPHILAFSLISAVPEGFLKFASTGLRDTTRIAASESELWSDIFLSNRKNILRSLDILQNNLGRIKSAINKKDKRLLNRILKQAKDKRDRL